MENTMNQIDELCTKILALLDQSPGLSKAELEAALPGQFIEQALLKLYRQGEIVISSIPTDPETKKIMELLDTGEHDEISI
jgi:hypothetical protein